MRNDEMPQPERKLSALKSIKFYCRYLCCAGDLKSWRYCNAYKCTLHKYRLGKGNKSGKGTAEQKQPSIPQSLDKNKKIQP